MKIILLDKIPNLGEIADVVEVNSGYARNFLIPQKKAMFASKNNLEYVAERKAELAAASADEMANAQGKAETVTGAKVEIKVQVTEEGALYGSVGTREISDAFSKIDHVVDKSIIQLPDGPLKELGDYSITLLFFLIFAFYTNEANTHVPSLDGKQTKTHLCCCPCKNARVWFRWVGSGDVDVVVEGRDRQEIFAAGAVVLRVGVVLFVVFGGLVETPEDRMSFVDVYRARQGA